MAGCHAQGGAHPRCGVANLAAVLHRLAAGFEVLLVDTRQLARVPGRSKSDRRDCEWAQRLYSCGLFRGAFRPSEQVCRLRTLVRDKGTLVAERGDWLRRMQKSLDQMNVRVHRAVSDLDGVTGMAIVRATVAGERDAHRLATLRDPCTVRAPAQSEEAESPRAGTLAPGALSHDGRRSHHDRCHRRRAFPPRSTSCRISDWRTPRPAANRSSTAKNRRARPHGSARRHGWRPCRCATARPPSVPTTRQVARRAGADVAVFATARKIAQYIYRPVRWQQPYVDAGAATYERRDQAARVNRLAETAQTLGYQLVAVQA